VGDVLQGVCHTHRPQGWAPIQKGILRMLFKIEGAGSIGSDASTSLSRLNARLLDQEVDQTQQPFTSKPTALSVRGRGNACVRVSFCIKKQAQRKTKKCSNPIEDQPREADL
jgi:hypothetical protein